MESTAAAAAREPFGTRSARVAPPRIGPSASQLSPRLRAILDELDSIFVEEGFARFTVGDLTSRLRCSRRTLYELAPTKDELVLVVLDRRLRLIGALAAEALATVEDPADRLEAFLLAGSSELKRTTLRFRADIAGFPAGQRLIAAHFKYATSLLGDLIEEGIEGGRFRPVHARLVAEIIDAALERLQDPEILRTEGISFEEAGTELAMLVRHGLAVDATPRARTR